MKNFVDVHY